MRNVLAALITTAAVALFGTAQAEDFKEGTHYEVLDKPIPYSLPEGKDSVVWEFFSYSCPHCYDLEPFLDAWKLTLPDNVQYQPVPAVFSNRMIPGAQAFYAVQSMGKLEEAHPHIFNVIHVQRQQLGSIEQYAGALGSIGIDKNEFLGVAKSFAVDGQVNKAQQLALGARIPGTPALIINGKYRVTGRLAGSNAKMIQVANFLISKDLQEK